VADLLVTPRQIKFCNPWFRKVEIDWEMHRIWSGLSWFTFYFNSLSRVFIYTIQYNCFKNYTFNCLEIYS